MKLILSSCDFGNPESASIIYANLGKPAKDCRILFFPNEKADSGKIRSGKYHSRIAAFGFRIQNIHVADYFSPASALPTDIDAVYISGGNTFGTMKRIRDAGFDAAIRNYVQNGAVYIGGSAGAHIASAEISHVAAYDRDTFGLTDFSGLGLYHGIFICHYSAQREADLRLLTAVGTYPVTALTDADSLVISDNS
ncbi:MAG: hypothetical protein E7632_07135 [Ruminococcaceae bacterium]|nr:hypothetical protein [Oscillospiraceae bacterium]